MLNDPAHLWAKIRRADPADASSPIVAWHPLADHCTDVCACFEALLLLPGFQRRAEVLLGSRLCPTRAARLSLLAFLHDIGKGNSGFQSKVFERARQHRSAPRGHLSEAVELIGHRPYLRLAAPALRLEEVDGWFLSCGEEDGRAGVRMLLATWSHHGVPLDIQSDDLPFAASGAWEPWEWASPEATLTLFSEEIDTHHGSAFGAAEPMVATARFQAFFAGLLMLADWMGSSEQWFPFTAPGDGPRLPWARAQAARVVASLGLDADQRRVALHERPQDYLSLFGIQTPNAMQRAVADLPIPGAPA